MNGVALSLAMLLYSTAPTTPVSQDVTVGTAAFKFELPDCTATSRSQEHTVLNEHCGTARPRSSLPPSQPTAPSRFSKADKIVAVVAGAVGGWLAGGMIGFAATSKPDDDVSGLRGVVIGAPIGSVIGAVIGYRLTK